MARASAGPVIAGELARPSTATVSMESLQAYAIDRLKAADAYPRERLIRRDFRLAKLDMTVWFASSKLAELCERTLVLHDDADPSATRLEICAMDASLDGWSPPAVWDEGTGFSSRDFDRILGAGGLRGFYHHDVPSWQFYDRAAAKGVQTLVSPLGIPPWESGSPFRLFLHWAYAAAGLRLTHAATLGLNGRGALITGASGSGKSGTTLAGLLNGLESVGDDYVLVEPGSRPIAHSVFTVFKQDPEGLRRAGIAPSVLQSSDLNWHGKIEFDPRRLAQGGLADRMEICALLLPEIARARRTTMERATVHEAALSLAPSGVFQLPGDTLEGFRFLADLARRLPAYRVKLSEDPAEIAGAIGSFLAGEVGHSG